MGQPSLPIRSSASGRFPEPTTPVGSAQPCSLTRMSNPGSPASRRMLVRQHGHAARCRSYTCRSGTVSAPTTYAPSFHRRVSLHHRRRPGVAPSNSRAAAGRYRLLGNGFHSPAGQARSTTRAVTPPMIATHSATSARITWVPAHVSWTPNKPTVAEM